MTTEQLRTTRNADPFIPFTIHMTSGKSYRVPHRDYLSIHPKGRIATVHLPTRVSATIDIMLITELERDQVPAVAGAEGI